VRVVLTLLGAVVIAATGFVLFRRVETGEWPRVDVDHIELLPLPKREAGPSRIIFLDRRGATLTGGGDDSTIGRSSIVAGAGKASVSIPAFRGGDKPWRQIVSCVKDQFAAFDVEIVEERPPRRGYVHVVVGGTPSLVGFPKAIGGLAPYGGEPVPDAVVLVFSRALGERTRPICETAAMEIAHAYGLDHNMICKDPMSYLTGCGKKTFQDKAAPCGEKKARPCGDGSTMQNSFRRLLAVLGPKKKI
jgi:hypothetical protein